MWEMILETTRGLNNKFPDGNVSPFLIMNRLMEECGELAAEVNHFEDIGGKRRKHGEPDRAKLAGEIKNVFWCVTQLMMYYDVEDKVRESLEQTQARMIEQGFISER